MTAEEVKVNKVLQVLTKQDFVFFTRYFFKRQYRRKWRQWEHLIIIADALQKVVDGEITRLIINVFPRGGKTELAVKSFIPYGLSLNPAAKFIHLSYSDDLALDNSETARDWISSEEYQQLFPHVRLKPSSKGKKKWYTEAGGGVYATSTGGQITGFGAGQVEEDEADFFDTLNEIESYYKDESWLGNKARFGGAIIIDDPNKVDDADSELLRNRVNERFDSTISTRVNSRKTPIIILQQRTHENDLSGYLIRKQGKIEDGGIWKVITLPSIKEDGTALCPDKFTLEELLALQQHNDVVFQRQHMQNPKPRTGLLFPIDDLQFFDMAEMQTKLNDPDFSYLAVDPASGNGGDDFAAGLSKLIGDKIYITDVLYNNDGADFNEIAVEGMVIENNIKFVGVEAVFGWKETADRIRDSLYLKKWNGDFRKLKPRTNKHVRIVNRSAFIRNNFVFRKDWDTLPQYAKFMRNLTSYQKVQEPGKSNKTDDAPDNCEMIATYFEKNFPHLWALK